MIFWVIDMVKDKTVKKYINTIVCLLEVSPEKGWGATETFIPLKDFIRVSFTESKCLMKVCIKENYFGGVILFSDWTMSHETLIPEVVLETTDEFKHFVHELRKLAEKKGINFELKFRMSRANVPPSSCYCPYMDRCLRVFMYIIKRPREHVVTNKSKFKIHLPYGIIK